MKIARKPVISDRIYLSDESLEFAAREGDLPRDEQAWVRIRQAREGDFVARAELMAKREVRYGGSFSEVIGDNSRERVKYEVFWTLHECKNLVDDDGTPVFGDGPTDAMKFQSFEAIWNSLETHVTEAIVLAVWRVNSGWRQ